MDKELISSLLWRFISLCSNQQWFIIPQCFHVIVVPCRIITIYRVHCTVVSGSRDTNKQVPNGEWVYERGRVYVSWFDFLRIISHIFLQEDDLVSVISWSTVYTSVRDYCSVRRLYSCVLVAMFRVRVIVFVNLCNCLFGSPSLHCLLLIPNFKQKSFSKPESFLCV